MMFNSLFSHLLATAVFGHIQALGTYQWGIFTDIFDLIQMSSACDNHRPYFTCLTPNMFKTMLKLRRKKWEKQGFRLLAPLYWHILDVVKKIKYSAWTLSDNWDNEFLPWSCFHLQISNFLKAMQFLININSWIVLHWENIASKYPNITALALFSSLPSEFCSCRGKCLCGSLVALQALDRIVSRFPSSPQLEEKVEYTETATLSVSL